MTVAQPPYPPKYKRNREFPARTPWKPERRVSATENIYPHRYWPIKPGKAVFVVTDITCGTVESGRVTWYNPARKEDHSALVSPGHPFFCVLLASGRSSVVAAERVFPYSRPGWERVIKFIAAELRALAQYSALRASRENQISEQYTKTANLLTKALYAFTPPARRA